ncbi:hypothetical protein GCM10009613_53410 [Pseudonocardia kongjuensis]|uniref:Uncharacterized protein n=1 Tax=Pseudonocardia kongjuensis TaxID=102227 RepID=A0ABP4ITY5_9PSEU
MPEIDPGDASVDVVGAAGERGRHPDRLGDGQLGQEPGLLQDGAGPAADGAPRGDRIEPEQPDGAGVRRAEPLDQLQRRRLARAVGAQQPEDLAGVHDQVDAVDRDRAAVPEAEAAHLDRRARGVPPPHRDTPAGTMSISSCIGSSPVRRCPSSISTGRSGQ